MIALMEFAKDVFIVLIIKTNVIVHVEEKICVNVIDRVEEKNLC